MSKKKKKKTNKKKLSVFIDRKSLPQNILRVGERVVQNKEIYIDQKIYKIIHKFANSEKTNESGGLLVGYVSEAFGKDNIVVVGFIEGKFCEATSTTLKFTHKTWDYFHKELEEKYSDFQIVGWIHTHPDFGVFLSEYDRFIHDNFFAQDNQIAYVVDPIRKEQGFYFWVNGILELCKGFYVFAPNGISVVDVFTLQEKDNGADKERYSYTKSQTVIIGILIFACLALSAALYNQHIKTLIISDNIVDMERNFQLVIQEINVRVNQLEDELNKPKSQTATHDENSDNSETKEQNTIANGQ